MMFLYCLQFLIIANLLGLVSSDDLKNESRQPRIFTFNADSEDVEVGFDFSIPFLKIPFKKTINAVAQFGFPGISIPKINLNPMALLLGGFLIISTSIFAPLLNKATAWHHLDRSSRTAFGNETDSIMYITEKLLSNSRSCPERIACWSSQRTKNPEVMKTLKQIMSQKLAELLKAIFWVKWPFFEDLTSDRWSSDNGLNHIVNSSNKLLSSIVNTTALEIATVKGRGGQNCELYNPCPIDEKTLPKIINSLAILTNFKTRR